MKIAIIGIFAGENYCYRMASVINHTNTAYEFPTQNYRVHDPSGMRITYPISILLGNHMDKIEGIIVVQSKIMIKNDTDIPLLLYKTESVEPYMTVENPNYVVKKLETLDDYEFYEHVISAAIALSNYNPNREKDIFLVDIPWLPLPFNDYVERLERSKHLICMQRVHDIDTFTVRVLESMACKTIPIIFYSNPDTKKLYESIGIDKEVAYFVSIKKYGKLAIKEYDIDMANRGYELVKEKFSMKVNVNKFMEIIENGTI